MARQTWRDSEAYHAYLSISMVTRYMLTATAVGSLMLILKLYPYYLFLNWNQVIKRFEIWRMLTCFFVLPPKLNSLFSVINFYKFSLEVEKKIFNEMAAEYAWFITFCMATILSLSAYENTVIYFDGIMLAVVQLWASYNAGKTVNFMFGFKINAEYLSLAFIGIEFLLSGGRMPWDMIYGYVAARIYYYLTVEYPSQRGGINYMKTPQIYYRIFSQEPNARIISVTERANAGRATNTESSGFHTFKPTGTPLGKRGEQSTSSGGTTAAPYAATSGVVWGKGRKLGG